eukprot:132192-Pleurochrysis_carterae.AAC.1
MGHSCLNGSARARAATPPLGLGARYELIERERRISSFAYNLMILCIYLIKLRITSHSLRPVKLGSHFVKLRSDVVTLRFP